MYAAVRLCAGVGDDANCHLHVSTWAGVGMGAGTLMLMPCRLRGRVDKTNVATRTHMRPPNTSRVLLVHATVANTTQDCG